MKNKIIMIKYNSNISNIKICQQCIDLVYEMRIIGWCREIVTFLPPELHIQLHTQTILLKSFKV